MAPSNLKPYGLTARAHNSRPRNSEAHDASGSRDLPVVVSLFSGAGGLDWGFREAGFAIPIAIDLSAAAIRTYNRNFRGGCAVLCDLAKHGPEGVVVLARQRISEGRSIGVIGGPPCQGFSRANTSARSDDARNRLPFLYLDIVSELQKEYSVEFVVFENVQGFGDPKHAPTHEALISRLASLGFAVVEQRLCALDFGVPQRRHRIIISGMREGRGFGPVNPRKRKGIATVREAIGGLVKPAFFQRGMRESDIPAHPNHWTMNPKSLRFKKKGMTRSDGRSFKRLLWQEPSPTIAFGHREIHVHPNGSRRLSIFEAMLLQGFPASFVLEGNMSEQVEQVSNAVPPPLARKIATAVKCALRASPNA